MVTILKSTRLSSRLRTVRAKKIWAPILLLAILALAACQPVVDTRTTDGTQDALAEPAPVLDETQQALVERASEMMADELGVDPARIAIGGNSAGAGLAAALTQLAADRGEAPVCFQLLVYPMLDDRTVLRPDHGGTGTFVWTPRSNEFAWTSYLGHPPGDHDARPYAVPARREDLTGLPPAWIGVGDLDLFHAEDLAYADRLRAAGVPCQVHVVAGMYHGADAFFRTSAAMTAFRAAMKDALSAALSTDG